jgi:phytoene dehydrogenase-like protein
MTRYDVVVVGAGPNGLAAAISLARAQLGVLVVERAASPGGGARSAGLTLPGFVHDVCSTVHPLALMAPFFRSIDLERHGVVFRHSPAELAHVVDEDTVVTLERSIGETARQLGPDREAYTRLLEPFVAEHELLARMVLGPLRYPEAPVLLARFGWSALRSMSGLASARFRGQLAPALLAGMAAHAMLPMDAAASASFGLVLAIAGHAVGWPVVERGSQALSNALVAELERAGGEIWLDHEVSALSELPAARAYVLDVTPKQLSEIAGNALPVEYRRQLSRFRYGPGVFKMDWALSGPIPWRDPSCARACTVHLSGSLAQVATSERTVHLGDVDPSRPFVLLVQPSIADNTRAPAGAHVAWAYCHVPSGDTRDRSAALEAHIERFAPGFSRLILARSTRNSADMEAYNPNYVGGDINGGSAELSQLFFRPLPRVDPYATASPNIFICSSSTPPGGGVHGRCGFWAARSVARRVFGRSLDTAPAVDTAPSRGRCRFPGRVSRASDGMRDCPRQYTSAAAVAFQLETRPRQRSSHHRP